VTAPTWPPSVAIPASDLCQRWRSGGRHSWRHRSEGGFDARRYDVAPLAEADARTFVAANDYSRTYPAARLRFGLYDGRGGWEGLRPRPPRHPEGVAVMGGTC
jgi:hypothetical protein